MQFFVNDHGKRPCESSRNNESKRLFQLGEEENCKESEDGSGKIIPHVQPEDKQTFVSQSQTDCECEEDDIGNLKNTQETKKTLECTDKESLKGARNLLEVCKIDNILVD